MIGLLRLRYEKSSQVGIMGVYEGVGYSRKARFEKKKDEQKIQVKGSNARA